MRAYQDYLRLAGASAPTKERAEAVMKIQDLSVEVGSIVVRAKAKGARVLVDGTFVGVTPLPEPVPVMPGKHVLALEGSSAKATVSVKEEQSVTVELEGAAPASVATAGPATAPTTASSKKGAREAPAKEPAKEAAKETPQEPPSTDAPSGRSWTPSRRRSRRRLRRPRPRRLPKRKRPRSPLVVARGSVSASWRPARWPSARRRPPSWRRRRSPTSSPRRTRSARHATSSRARKARRRSSRACRWLSAWAPSPS
ncbi:MAG: PEGA domain-containing protein [Myxococcales bacterium]|nr:PEGA domain-containing protein [Myxococcales bacterium]